MLVGWDVAGLNLAKLQETKPSCQDHRAHCEHAIVTSQFARRGFYWIHVARLSAADKVVS